MTASTTLTCKNTSAGIILLSPDKQSLFIQRRQKFPWGWACPAGHVDAGLISEEAWHEEPGLEGVWYDFLVARRLITSSSQKAGLL